jgi:hypothetical protein
MLHYACIACEAHFPKLSSLSDHYATVHSDDTVGIEGNAAHLEIQADILLQAETVNGMRKLISSYKWCMTLTQVLDNASTSADINTNASIEHIDTPNASDTTTSDAELLDEAVHAYGLKMTTASRAEFDENYQSMAEDKKWWLRSGRCVEDMLYKYSKSLKKEK